jgi:acetyl-CoA carboxylase biotin carboxyl carrier protein
MTDIKPEDIEALLETFDGSTWQDLHLKIEGLEIFVSKTPGARGPALTRPHHEAEPAPFPSARAPAAAAAPHAKAALTGGAGAKLSKPEAPAHWVTVRAPNLGTFYRAPKPGAEPYVSVGQKVEADTELCLIEVMKLFTNVLAGVAGTVRQILVEDTELVEYDQPLFLIEPA